MTPTTITPEALALLQPWRQAFDALLEMAATDDALTVRLPAVQALATDLVGRLQAAEAALPPTADPLVRDALREARVRLAGDLAGGRTLEDTRGALYGASVGLRHAVGDGPPPVPRRPPPAAVDACARLGAWWARVDDLHADTLRPPAAVPHPVLRAAYRALRAAVQAEADALAAAGHAGTATDAERRWYGPTLDRVACDLAAPRATRTRPAMRRALWAARWTLGLTARRQGAAVSRTPQDGTADAR